MGDRIKSRSLQKCWQALTTKKQRKEERRLSNINSVKHHPKDCPSRNFSIYSSGSCERCDTKISPVK